MHGPPGVSKSTARRPAGGAPRRSCDPMPEEKGTHMRSNIASSRWRTADKAGKSG